MKQKKSTQRNRRHKGTEDDVESNPTSQPTSTILRCRNGLNPSHAASASSSQPAPINHDMVSCPPTHTNDIVHINDKIVEYIIRDAFKNVGLLVLATVLAEEDRRMIDDWARLTERECRRRPVCLFVHGMV
jgi:hypothetical protein